MGLTFQVRDSKRRPIVASPPASVSTVSGPACVFVDGNASAVVDKPVIVIPLHQSFCRGVQSRVVPLDAQAAAEILDEIKGVPCAASDPTNELKIVLSSSGGSLGGISVSKQPLLLSNMPADLLGAMDDDERLKRDLSLRAADVSASSSSYEHIPIHEFGAAMLRGMGWVESKEEAENFDKKYSAPVVARESRVGLGATSKPPGRHSRGSKSKLEQEMHVWTQKVNERIGSQDVNNGHFVWIRDPLYAGCRAVVVATRGVPGLDKIRVSLEVDGSLVEIKKHDVVLLSDAEMKEEPYNGVPLRTVVEQEDNKRKKEYVDDVSGSDSKKRRGEAERSGKDQDEPSKWLHPGIRVRIISNSKKAGGNSGHLQKATVIDVCAQGTASLQLDDGSVLQHVKEKYLETVLPAVGSICMILTGEHRGQTAQLLEKRKESERAVVQLNNAEVVVGMEAIAALS